jgi:sulfur carrier protein ThiS
VTLLDIFEKLLWVLTALVIVGVIGLAVYGPKSTIRDEDWMWEFAQMNAAASARPNVALPGSRGRTFTPGAPGAPRAAASGAQAPGQAQSPGGNGASPYADPRSGSPATHLQQGGQYVEGVYQAPPVYLPSSMRRKYSKFQDLVDLGQTASSFATEVDGQDAVQLEWIDERSPLSSHLGLQPGDVIVSVNGRPASRQHARQLYEELRHERDFEILVIRNSQRMTLNYSVR